MLLYGCQFGYLSTNFSISHLLIFTFDFVFHSKWGEGSGYRRKGGGKKKLNDTFFFFLGMSKHCML